MGNKTGHYNADTATEEDTSSWQKRDGKCRRRRWHNCCDRRHDIQIRDAVQLRRLRIGKWRNDVDRRLLETAAGVGSRDALVPPTGSSWYQPGLSARITPPLVLLMLLLLLKAIATAETGIAACQRLRSSSITYTCYKARPQDQLLTKYWEAVTASTSDASFN